MNGYAAIFDMDGVLIDSYQAHYQSWLATARLRGLDFTEEQFRRTFGQTSREIIATLWGEGRFNDAEIAAFDAQKEAAYRCLIADNPPLMPGATELLDSLRRAGFRLAIGSSGPPENVELVLAGLGRQRFDAIVTGRDVTRGKPDPQVFLTAAARLSIEPACCAVVEDAPPGVAAAKAAGMAVIGLASTGRTREELTAADLVVDRLDELRPETFAGLIAQRIA